MRLRRTRVEIRKIDTIRQYNKIVSLFAALFVASAFRAFAGARLVALSSFVALAFVALAWAFGLFWLFAAAVVFFLHNTEVGAIIGAVTNIRV